MILVNIRKHGRHATTDAEVMAVSIGDWYGINDAALDRYADVLLAVRGNVVRGAYRIVGWSRVEGGKVRFDVVTDPALASFVGEPSPKRWVRGQNRPVLYVD